MNSIPRIILRFVILLAIQVLICNNVQFLGFINPYVYILAILLLPFEIPKSVQLIVAFTTGFIVDSFFKTYGVHASATLLVAFVRPSIAYLLNGRKNNSEGIERPLPGSKDFNWLFWYAFILTLIHHFTVTLLESFTFKFFWKTVLLSLVNALITTIVILCIEYIFYNPKKGNK